MWSKKHSRCIECKTQDIEHEAKGKCKKCYDRQKNKSSQGRAKKRRYRQKRRILRRIESMEGGYWWHHLAKENKLLQMRHPRTNKIVAVPVLKGGRLIYEDNIAIEIYKDYLNETTT